MTSVPNRLKDATSPYLLQHADNPVDWWEWEPAAFEEARRRDVPVLLSVGYAACHWCHVMAHESFEDEATAAYLNEHYVSIKVDREERPDVDSVYMNATTAMTGHGGWPMTCVLDHDGNPWFAGTYFPDKPRHGQPAFTQVLQALAEAWRDKPEDVRRVAGNLREHLNQGLPTGSAPIGEATLARAVDSLATDFDAERGGFGGAPKFPPSALLEALLRAFERTGSPLPLESVIRTGTAMARGGIYDQLAGGFARYSVDADWVVPHFEKMLYDNALLLRAYAHWARRTGDPLARRIAAQTAGFLLDDLADGDMFTSALDADAAGVEGSTYVWTPGQLAEVLGADDGRWAASLFEVTEGGTFEDGASVLQLLTDPDDVERFERVRLTLLASRLARVQPARDDKIVTAWNGLAITALAEASVALDVPPLLSAALRCAEALLDLHIVDGRPRRASLGGVVGDSAAILEDHAMLATGLLALYQLTGEGTWLSSATALIDVALEHFADPERPGRWFDTADDAEQLMVRPADPLDGATPSGASSIAEALLTAAHLVDADRAVRYGQAAEDTLLAHSPLLARAPRSSGHWLAVAEAAVRGPLQVAVATDRPDSELLAAARQLAPGGTIVVGGAVDSSPLLEGRDQVNGNDAAYVCRGRTCDLPVTGAGQLADALGVSV